jgi:hypothetical protein
MAKEKADSIRHAKMLQKCQDPRYRELHSQMLMSDVLMERDLQMEYQAKRSIIEKIHEKEYVLQLRLDHLRNVEQVRQKQQDAITKRYEFASDLQKAVDEKCAKKNLELV